MIGAFLSWWGGQLRSLLPASGFGQGSGIVAALSTASAHTVLDVTARRRGKPAALGRFTVDPAGMTALRDALGQRRAPIELSLPPGMLLEQNVTLPAAAEPALGQVLRYEMDRLTPFTANELFWGWAVQRRDRARGSMSVRLFLAPQAALVPILDALRQAGLHPAALQGGPGQWIDLGRAQAKGWRRRAVPALAALCAVLAASAVTIPFVQQWRASRQIERQIAALQPAVDRAEVLRRKLVSASACKDVLAAELARVGDPLSVLAALTDILPDDAVLTELAMRQRVVTISGQAASAARLIPALAADQAFRDPAFIAAVTRNETLHSEGFSIRAEAVP